MARLINGNSDTQISDSEANAFLNTWSKERHVSEINQLHDELFNSILSEYGYASFAELSIWAQEPNNEYYTEANAIKNWYQSTWLLIRDYSNVVIEETKIDPQEFIHSLPKL
jgi:hypothetical protein